MNMDTVFLGFFSDKRLHKVSGELDEVPQFIIKKNKVDEIYCSTNEGFK
jgi:hypothetical protein